VAYVSVEFFILFEVTIKEIDGISAAIIASEKMNTYFEGQKL
jgi:hypothetical protein